MAGSNELLIVSVFQDHILLIFMKKKGTKQTSPDNRVSTVLQSQILIFRLLAVHWGDLCHLKVTIIGGY